MSTYGRGTAVVANPATVGAGQVVAGIAMVGIDVAVGGGILIYQGAMYCGQKMQEHYENSCRAATGRYEAGPKKNLGNVTKQKSPHSSQGAATSASTVSTPSAEDLTETRALIQHLTEDALATMHLKDEMEKELLADRLRAAIDAGRSFLPVSVLAEAENALGGTPATRQYALEQVERAWQQVTDAHAQQMRQTLQAQHALNGVVGQLANIDTLLYTLGETKHSVYLQRKHVIEAWAREAEQQLSSNPARALTLANDVQQLATTLAADVSSDSFDRWEGLRRKQMTLLGMLTALEQMVLEARVLKLMSAVEADSLKQRIQDTHASIQRFLNAGLSPRAQREALLLNEHVELLKKEVFQRVQTSQQRSIAQTIAKTLVEVGFQGTRGEAPVLQINGDTIRVVVKRAGHTSGFVRDDKHVAFDITRDGEISYDFSGYVGDTCVADAKKIFTALRKNGVYILDDEAIGKLQQTPGEQVTPSLLAQDEFQPQLTRKKQQAELVDRLSRVLAQMNYQNIKKSSAGGTIEIDAFNGTIGYHIVLPSEGDVQVLKDAQRKDISHDSSDPIVVEASHAPEIEQADEVSKQHEAHRSVQQRKQISH